MNTLKQTAANIAIAEADGWTHLEYGYGWEPDCTRDKIFAGEGLRKLPSYTGPSGDPIRAAIARLTEENKTKIAPAIFELCYLDLVETVLVSPLTLCTAYLRVVLNDPQLTIEV